MSEKAEFEPRITRLRQRIADLEEQVHHLAQAAALQDELRLISGRLDTFATQVRDGLAGADWLRRREIIRALVKRVEVGEEELNVVFRVEALTLLWRAPIGAFCNIVGGVMMPVLVVTF